MYKGFLKRLIDIILSFFAVVLLALPMLIIVLAIVIDSKGSPIFTQKRVGKGKKHFKIYKFRTMRIELRMMHLHIPLKIPTNG